jgi:hypothetical protein
MVAVTRLTQRPRILMVSLVSTYQQFRHIRNVLHHQAKAHCGIAMNDYLGKSTEAMKRMRQDSLPNNVPTSLITPVHYIYASVLWHDK